MDWIYVCRYVHKLYSTRLASYFGLFTVEASSAIPDIYENH